MNIDEIFDKAVRGLLSQGLNQCINIDYNCIYSNKDKTMHCAWGWVNTDLVGSTHVASVNCHIYNSLSIKDKAIARNLQAAHDKGYNPSAMALALLTLAEDYNIVVKPDVLEELRKYRDGLKRATNQSVTA